MSVPPPGEDGTMNFTGFEGHASCACAPSEKISAARKAGRRFMRASYIHVHSIRIATGEEVLVARVLAEDGRVGYGFSFRLDATAARHMAEWHAGVRAERPPYESQLDHAWERSFLSEEEIEWQTEPAFSKIRWQPE